MATPKHPLGFVIVLLCVLVLASSAIALSLPLFTFQCTVVGNFDFYSNYIQPPVGGTQSYSSNYVETRLPTIFSNKEVFRTNLILSSVAICFAFAALGFSIPLLWLGHDKALWGLLPSLVVCVVLMIDAAAIVSASVLVDFNSVGDEVCAGHTGQRIMGAAGVFQYIGGGAAFLALFCISLLFCCESVMMIQEIRKSMRLSTSGGIGTKNTHHIGLHDEAVLMNSKVPKKGDDGLGL
eukprot:c7544_g2_i1.p1 GENE.c7544_g2_i1~~c7544_g2_i1.p1  ORF type:complete len:237 (-),score=67.76 c7544_g2_i1:396-1106(-)